MWWCTRSWSGFPDRRRAADPPLTRRAVHHVGTAPGETELGVDGERGVVVRLDVQDHFPEAALAQVIQPDQGQRLAQAAALLGRVDAEDVHLADRAGGVGAVVVDLGPVEA